MLYVTSALGHGLHGCQCPPHHVKRWTLFMVHVQAPDSQLLQCRATKMSAVRRRLHVKGDHSKTQCIIAEATRQAPASP